MTAESLSGVGSKVARVSWDVDWELNQSSGEKRSRAPPLTDLPYRVSPLAVEPALNMHDFLRCLAIDHEAEALNFGRV
jgi:hypothetical protein